MHKTGEANKLIADYKYKLTKSEQEIASLQASLARSETQVIRYKSTADAAEKVEAELKIERRKLQREVGITLYSRMVLVYMVMRLCSRSFIQVKLEEFIRFSQFLRKSGTNVTFNDEILFYFLISICYSIVSFHPEFLNNFIDCV